MRTTAAHGCGRPRRMPLGSPTCAREAMRPPPRPREKPRLRNGKPAACSPTQNSASPTDSGYPREDRKVQQAAATPTPANDGLDSARMPSHAARCACCEGHDGSDAPQDFV